MTIDYPAGDQIPGLRELWREAFGDGDAFLDTFFSTAYSPTRCRCVTVEGRVAAALYWFGCRCGGAKFAYIYAVATADAFRGRGLCHALMEDTHALLTRQGCAGAILVPGEPELRQLYAGMGYLPGGSISRLCCPAGAVPVRVQPIDAGRYAARRAELLPRQGVIQQGENLTLLAATAELYAGDDFLLAAVLQDGVLQGLELLGNTAAAPGITAALGAKSGQFRIPGEDREFAMYRPLTPHCPKPAYFGLAFD